MKRRTLPLLLCLSVVAGARQVSLSLGGAMALARDSGLAAQTAASRVAQAEDAAREGLAPLLPRVDVQASHLVRRYNLASTGLYPSTAVPLFGNEDARLSARWSLDLPAFSRLRASRLAESAARSRLLAARDQAALAAGLAWMELARAEALLAARDSSSKLAVRLREMAEEQARAGSATRLDVLRARAQEAQTARLLSAARLAVEMASETLRDRLVLPQGILVHLDGGLALEGNASDTALGAQGHELPAVVAAREAAASADARRAAERAAWFPSLGVTGDWGLSGYRLNSAAEWTGSVGVAATWNLWEGGAREARIRSAEEARHQAEISRREESAADELAIRTGIVAVREGARQLALSREASELADQELELATERFRSGATGNLDVVQAQTEANAARAAWIEAAGSFQAARLRLLHATGTLDRIKE